MRFSKIAIYLCVPFVALKESSGECPNACSGHGQCGSFDMCSCERNWQGADCSLSKFETIYCIGICKTSIKQMKKKQFSVLIVKKCNLLGPYSISLILIFS